MPLALAAGHVLVLGPYHRENACFLGEIDFLIGSRLCSPRQWRDCGVRSVFSRHLAKRHQILDSPEGRDSVVTNREPG